MKVNLILDVSISNVELLKVLAEELGINQDHMYLNPDDNKVWSDERIEMFGTNYDHKTLVDPKLFSAFNTIKEHLLRNVGEQIK